MTKKIYNLDCEIQMVSKNVIYYYYLKAIASCNSTQNIKIPLLQEHVICMFESNLTQSTLSICL